MKDYLWWEQPSRDTRREPCPICSRRVRVGNGNRVPMKDHYRSCHPEEYEKFRKECEKLQRQLKLETERAEIIAKERPYRKIILNGEMIDEIIDTLRSTADMMEPYYSQCGGMNDALELADRLDTMLTK